MFKAMGAVVEFPNIFIEECNCATLDARARWCIFWAAGIIKCGVENEPWTILLLVIHLQHNNT